MGNGAGPAAGVSSGKGPEGSANKGRCPIKAVAEEVSRRGRAHGRRQLRRGLPALGKEVRRLRGKVGIAGAGLLGQRITDTAPPSPRLTGPEGQECQGDVVAATKPIR